MGDLEVGTDFLFGDAATPPSIPSIQPSILSYLLQRRRVLRDENS